VGEYNVAMELLVFWWKNTVTNKHHKMAAHEYYKGSAQLNINAVNWFHGEK